MIRVSEADLRAVAPRNTRREHIRKLRDEIERVHAIEWMQSRGARPVRVADARDIDNARKALKRALNYLQRDDVQNYLDLSAPILSATGGRVIRRAKNSNGKFADPAVAAIRDTLRRFDEGMGTRVRVAAGAPRWHHYVPRLRALYRAIARDPANLWQGAGEKSAAAKFVGGALRLAGVNVTDDAVARYPRKARLK